MFISSKGKSMTKLVIYMQGPPHPMRRPLAILIKDGKNCDVDTLISDEEKDEKQKVKDGFKYCAAINV